MSINPDSNNCKGRKIEGNPRYISPFNTDLTCATNHQVLLSDGAATSTTNTVQNYIKGLPGIGQCRSGNGDIPGGDGGLL